MSKIRFVHVRSTKGGCPVGTLALRIFGGKMSVGWSIQNPSDPWNRSMGRDIAGGRSVKCRIMIDEVRPETKHEDLVIAAVNSMLAVDGSSDSRELFGDYGLPRKFKRALVETMHRAQAAKARREKQEPAVDVELSEGFTDVEPANQPF